MQLRPIKPVTEYERFRPTPRGIPLFRSQAISRLEQLPPAVVCVYIEAPPGYGKSSILEYFHQRKMDLDGAAVWIALEPNQNTLSDLLTLLRKALEERFDAGDQLADLSLNSPREAARELAAFLGTQSTADDPFQSPTPEIFIDALECCTDLELPAFLSAMIESLHWGRLWITTAHHLDFDYTRPMTAGRLHLPTAQSLCFDTTDIRQFLQQRTEQDWPSKLIEEILTRTQGLPIAVSIIGAVLQMEQQPEELIREFGGRDQALVSWLRSNWLSRLDAALQDYLFRLAWLDPIDRKLCEEAIGRDETTYCFDQLLVHNSYLTSLDRNGNRYSMQPLVREFLREESLRRSGFAATEAMLLRAMAWTRQQGRMEEAVEYALSSCVTQSIAEILNEVAPVWVGQKGLLLSYINWIERARKLNVSITLECEYWYLWALLFARQYQAAYQQSEDLWARSSLESAMEDSPEQSRAFWRRFEELRILIDIFSDRTSEASQKATQWLEDADAQNDISMATMACCVAIHNTVNFDFRAARQAIHTARRGTFAARSEYGTAWVDALAAQIDYYEGELLHCRQTLSSSLDRSIQLLGNDSNVISTTRLLLAGCLLQMGRPGEASRHLLAALDHMPTHGVSESTFCGIQTALDLWDGSDEGRITPHALRIYLANYPPPMNLVFDCCLIRRLLRLERLEEAVLAAEVAGLRCDSLEADPRISPPFVQELEALTRMDLMMAQGRFRQATQLAEALLRQAEARHRNVTIIELCIALTLMASDADKLTLTQRHLQQAIRYAARRGILQPFLAQMDRLRAVVARFRMRDWSFANSEEKKLFERICGCDYKETTLNTEAEEAISGSLTARELELLRLAQAGLSNQQIAERSGISLSTVKWHFQNIYTKLEVRNRSAATAKLRTLNLL